METFTIKTDRIDLKIAIIDIGSIHMHEETIPAVVQALAADLLRDSVLRHPVIVDEKTIVVLDGMHRAAALKAIECIRIPVCFVDYDNPSIRVETWYRALNRKDSRSLTEELTHWNIKARESNIQEAKKNLEAGAAAAFIATNRECLMIENTGGDVRQNFQLVASIEHIAESLGYEVSYETERDALKELEEGKAQLILGPPRVTKQDVRRVGLKGDLFPHKATRHIIPARPLGVDVPIKILRNQRTELPQANRQLMEALKKRRLERLDPGSLIENRRYEEQVFLFR